LTKIFTTIFKNTKKSFEVPLCISGGELKISSFIFRLAYTPLVKLDLTDSKLFLTSLKNVIKFYLNMQGKVVVKE